MNFIIFIVGLTSFLHDSSQTGLITVQYDELPYLLDSISGNQLINILKESLEKPGEDICSLMSKSRTFKIENEPTFPSLKLHKNNSFDSLTPIVGPKLKQELTKFRRPRPIENILNLEMDPLSSKDDLIIAGLINWRPEILSVTTCSLSHSTLCYISSGIKLYGITIQFIFGKIETSPLVPKLLAAISKPNVKLVKGMKFETLLLKLKNTPTDTKEYIFRQWNKSKFSMEYIWISAAIADYECDNDRKNFNLRFPENGSILTISASKDQNKAYIPDGTPIIRFGVEDRDTNQKIMTIVIIPNYFGDKSTYFYGIEDDSGKFTLKHCVNVTFQ